MEKKCFKCGLVKDLSNYYKHVGMLDGHLNKCKDCAKSDVNKHRSKNIERIREYDRNRPNHDKRIKQNRDRLASNEELRKKRNNLTQNWRIKNRHKANAHQKVARALLHGDLIRPASCEMCSSNDKLHAHHEDYNKALDVIWLCVNCHSSRHKEINETRRKEEYERQNT